MHQITLTAEQIITAKRDWLTVSHINAAFRSADDYVAFLRGGSTPGSSSPATPPAPASSSAPPSAADVVARLGHVPTREEVWRAEWATMPGLQRTFSTSDSYVWHQRGVEAGSIPPDARGR